MGFIVFESTRHPGEYDVEDRCGNGTKEVFRGRWIRRIPFLEAPLPVLPSGHRFLYCFALFGFFSESGAAGGGRMPLSSSFLESMSTFTPAAGIGNLSDQRTPCTTKRRYS